MSAITFFIALLPIACIVMALAVLKVPSHIASLAAFAVAAALAIAFCGMPAGQVATAALEGVLSALWPICLVILAALFLYNLMVDTGAMDQVKRMLTMVSPDRRILVLLIGWGFSNFMEGIAGFGTAVAIPASMLAGIGVNPLAAVVGCLVVNSTPTAFGSVGMATSTVASITGLDPVALSGSTVALECALAFISPFFLVAICCGGLKALRGIVPATCIAAAAFVVPWAAVACLLGPELPDIIGAATCMACIVAFAMLMKGRPAEDMENAEDAEGEGNAEVAGNTGTANVTAAHADAVPSLTLAQGLRAWAPFIIASALLLVTSRLFPPINEPLMDIKTTAAFFTGPEARLVTFQWVNTPGVMVLIAAVTGGLLQGARLDQMARVLGRTLKGYWRTIATICFVVAMSRVMTYAGMITCIASMLIALAGPLYPVMAPLIGALGGFVTGSGTSTNVLFGQLQMQTAAGLGLSETWIVASNAVGAGIGKMICPQSIAIGAGATSLTGQESKIMGTAFRYFVIYCALASLFCMAGALLAV